MKDLSALVLRLTTGSLLAGHGAQKLFGWFGGHGLKGTAQWMESLDLKPGRSWALAAGGAEFGGGVLTMLGFLGPLGPVGTLNAMAMAARKAHWGKPIWVTSGGAELPLTNSAVATALLASGPGKYSLDHLLHLRVPAWLAVPGLVAGASVLGYDLWKANRAQPSAAQPTQPSATAAEPTYAL